METAGRGLTEGELDLKENSSLVNCVFLHYLVQDVVHSHINN